MSGERTVHKASLWYSRPMAANTTASSQENRSLSYRNACETFSIDKYTLETKDLAAITRRDPTIVNRIWPVAENYTALVLLDNLMAHFGYQTLMEKVAGK